MHDAEPRRDLLRYIGREALLPEPHLNGVPAALCGDFAEVSQGLYLFLFSNEADEHVYDNPKNEGRRKIVVHKCGLSVKAGKFEAGFVNRVREYNEHLHRVRSGGREWVLGQTFRGGYLLDLTAIVEVMGSGSAGVFEAYWIEAVDAFLKVHGLLADPPIVQRRRSEWRYLECSRWTTEANEELRQYLFQIAQRLFHMAQVGSFAELLRPANHAACAIWTSAVLNSSA
jgi:hypothetical protein